MANRDLCVSVLNPGAVYVRVQIGSRGPVICATPWVFVTAVGRLPWAFPLVQKPVTRTPRIGRLVLTFTSVTRSTCRVVAEVAAEVACAKPATTATGGVE